MVWGRRTWYVNDALCTVPVCVNMQAFVIAMAHIILPSQVRDLVECSAQSSRSGNAW